MGYIILACFGIVIAMAGGVYLARLLYYKKFGVTAKAEVMNVNEIKRRKGFLLNNVMKVGRYADCYTHTIKYDVGGKSYEEQDKAGYTQPLKVGSTHLILCDPKDPSKFKFEEDVTRHITIAAVLVAMAVVFAVRFIYTYIK